MKIPALPKSSISQVNHLIKPSKPRIQNQMTLNTQNQPFKQFNQTLKSYYIGSKNKPKSEPNFKPMLANLATYADYNLAIGAPSWHIPTTIGQTFADTFSNTPDLFSDSPLPIDSQEIIDAISTISKIKFSNNIQAIPTPSSKVSAQITFETLKQLGVTHVAFQVPYFTPSVIAALQANLTIIPIFETNEEIVCQKIETFAKTYKNKGVFWHNPTNPVQREFSDNTSIKITTTIIHSVSINRRI